MKRHRVYQSTGETVKGGSAKYNFGMKGNRAYEGVVMNRGVPEYDEWLSIAKDFQNPTGANVMIYETWKNIRELWNSIEKYWAVMNMVIWHLPNRMQGFSRAHQFYNKYDIAVVGEKGKAPNNEAPEQELENYLNEKGEKLAQSYDIILYAHDKTDKNKSFTKDQKKKWGRLTDHISWISSSTKSSGQSLIFGTKPLQILVPYIKAMSNRDGIVAEPYGGSGSTLIACEIMKRKCRAIELSPLYAEVILRRWEKFTGQKAVLQRN